MTHNFYYLKNPELELLKVYKTEYEALSKTEVSIDYLQKADTYCFFSGPKMVGGLVLASASNGNSFRYFSIFEGNEDGVGTLRVLKKKFGVDEKEAVEISCIWMKRKIIPKYRIFFYRIMLSETLKLVREKGYRYIFGGSVELHIQQFQQKFFSTVFYLGIRPQDKGALNKSGGMAVMIYFLDAGSLRFQALRLLYNLIWSNLCTELKLKLKIKWGSVFKKTKVTIG
ncbi:hypothetical protein [Flectobacillus longus]|uniref:hypothetical protein n=1 Tax=Flectobacillus longus TaxID=2984207 RepID=UPI0024B729B7|nr:hypothetical protein [Flectobacillus longus]MDI9878293.1 hypothetical protein [Flectobacillus longus]